ncbi:hypothetical protein D3C77_676770 [compost metagenome]
MQQVMPGARQHRFEAAQQLVLALGTGLETRQPLFDAPVDALIQAGLEMQPVKLRQATPVAAK